MTTLERIIVVGMTLCCLVSGSILLYEFPHGRDAVQARAYAAGQTWGNVTGQELGYERAMATWGQAVEKDKVLRKTLGAWKEDDGLHCAIFLYECHDEPNDVEAPADGMDGGNLTEDSLRRLRDSGRLCALMGHFYEWPGGTFEVGYFGGRRCRWCGEPETLAVECSLAASSADIGADMNGLIVNREYR